MLKIKYLFFEQQFIRLGNGSRCKMNSDMTLIDGPVFLVAILIRQIALIYATYRILIKPNDEKSIRENISGIVKNRLKLGEFNTDAPPGSCCNKTPERHS